ncbi:MAG: DUF3419 family protein [Limisphaerales bacterium]
MQTVNPRPTTWLEQAGQFPVAFAQVREDPLLDLAVVRRAGRSVRMLMIASGGETAAQLVAAANLRSLVLVDPNPAQLALTRLKLDLLQNTTSEQRTQLVGQAGELNQSPCRHIERRLTTLGVCPGLLGPAGTIEMGVDHAGRYELLFTHLRQELKTVQPLLERLLRMNSLARQRTFLEGNTKLVEQLKGAFKRVMSLPNLVRLFGTGATANRVVPFARHFFERTLWSLRNQTAGDNPWMWQMLMGRFNCGHVYPWLSADRPDRVPAIYYVNRFMNEALNRIPAGAFNVVHLSNILDWLSPEEATETLALAARALAPGGWVIIRQLNSTLDVRGAGSMLEWDADWSDALHRSDRSFFYRAIHVGRKGK